MKQIDGVRDRDNAGYQSNRLFAIEAPPCSDTAQQPDRISLVSQHSDQSIQSLICLSANLPIILHYLVKFRVFSFSHSTTAY